VPIKQETQDATRERIFQDAVVRQMVAGGWEYDLVDI
jgi:hypothetical protein